MTSSNNSNSKSNKTTVINRITAYLGGRKTNATTVQIIKAVGGNVGTVKARLSDLTRSGTITRVLKQNNGKNVPTFTLN